MSAGRPSHPLRLLLPVMFLSVCLACSARGIRPVTTPGEGFRASCKGRLILGSETVRFRGGVALSPPDRIRVEMRGPVGGTRALFLLREGRVLLLLPGSREYFDEPAEPGAIEALLGVTVDAQGLFELITSADPHRCGEAEEVPGLRLECRGGTLIASFEGGALELRLDGIERRIAVPADLFAIDPPAGWTRLSPGVGSDPGFLLRQ